MKRIKVTYGDGIIDQYTTDQSYEEVLAQATEQAKARGTFVRGLVYQ